MSWPLAKLGSVIFYIRGVTFKPSDVVEVFSDDSIVVMRTKNVQITGLDESDLIAISSSLVKRQEQYIQEDDLLISSANSWDLVGKSSYVSALGYKATAGGFISIIRAQPKKIVPRYLYHWIMLPKVQHAIRYCGRQTTNISNLDVERFKDLEIPLPPLAEQKRIAAILDKADSLRRKRQQAIQLADQFLRAVFLDMFGDPVTNPKGWKKYQIGDVIEKVKTWNPQSESGVIFDYIDLSSVDNSTKEIIATNRTESSSAPSRARQLIKSGDVLVSTVRPNLNGVAKVMFESDYLTASTGYCVLRPRLDLITQNYLFFLVTSESFVREMMKMSTGANYPAVSDAIIKKYEFELPSIRLLEEFDKVCGSMVGIKNNAKNFLNEKLFDSLSQKAFAGKL